MKKYIIKVLSGLSFFILFYLIFLLIWGGVMPPWYQKNLYAYRSDTLDIKKQEAVNATDVDILFLGSSHSACGFDPRIFSEYGYENTLNLGTGGQTPICTEMFLNQYIDNLNPKLVIFEVYPKMFCDDGTEGLASFFVNDYLGESALSTALAENKMIIYNTLLFSYLHRNVLGTNRFMRRIELEGKYIPKGFVENPSKVKKKIKRMPLAWEFNAKQIDAFGRIIEELKSRRIQYILVQAPLTSVMNDSITNNDQVDEFFQSYGEYVNFNERLDLDDYENFFDYNHLNLSGVKIFNEAFIEYMKKHGY